MFSWLNKTKPPRLAMVTWSRNCGRFLAANLSYHYALGVRRAYVFLDRCTDSSECIAGSFPWAQTFVLDPAETESFDYVPDVQAICMNEALRLARQEGFDWLLALDPDEFAYAAEDRSAVPHDSQRNAAIRHGHLGRLLKQVPSDVEVVRLQVKELIPMDLGDETPFWEQRFFQFREAVPRDIADPLTGEVKRCDRFIGQTDGKSILRTSVDAQAYDPHQWVCNQERQYPNRPEYVPLKQVWQGVLYHFHITSYQHWRQKWAMFENEPDIWQDGRPVEFPKLCWKKASARLSQEELARYFSRWVAMPEADLKELARQGRVSEERTVEEVLSNRIAATSAHNAASTVRFFRLLRPPKVTCLADSMTYSMGLGDPGCLDGFHGLERSGGELFRWSKPVARVRLNVVPGDYLLTIDMKHCQRVWSGSMQLYVNDRPVPDRVKATTRGAVCVQLLREHFDQASENWLRLVIDRVDTSRWPNSDPGDLGAPIFGISLKPIRPRKLKRWTRSGSKSPTKNAAAAN
jgi:hypothetical protein